MIFLSFLVPMLKFGAKVELRCNDGMYLNPLTTVCLTFFFFLFAMFSAGNPTRRVIRSPVTSLAHPGGGEG